MSPHGARFMCLHGTIRISTSRDVLDRSQLLATSTVVLQCSEHAWNLARIGRVTQRPAQFGEPQRFEHSLAFSADEKHMIILDTGAENRYSHIVPVLFWIFRLTSSTDKTGNGRLVVRVKSVITLYNVRSRLRSSLRHQCQAQTRTRTPVLLNEFNVVWACTGKERKTRYLPCDGATVFSGSRLLFCSAGTSGKKMMRNGGNVLHEVTAAGKRK